ncbi:uncharacterized protein LOC141649780 [Silene latifolia]|uniref:uncharacterized protein LOC141649780 n=1 Tax=Silene latifolia TaxID=37657 RepID=UPI003D77BA3E
MGFAGQWIFNNMRCVRSVSYEVLINGAPSEPFVPTRGLRQGDPLSPYLFILCAEVLSSMIRRKVEEGVLHGIRVAPGAPVVSHLFFADDSIIFVKANENQARVVMDVLSKYERASGQLVSKKKTMVSFSKGTVEWRREKVARVLGVQVVAEQDRYLGLPTVIGQSKHALTKIVCDKLNNKMQGWRVNFCNDLRSIVSRFWWGSAGGARKISWLSWEFMCRAKGKYFPNGTFIDAPIGNNPSYTWRSICEAKCVMGLGLRKRVGNGIDTRVWLDPWIPNTSSRCVVSPREDNDLEMKVAELMVVGESRWDREKVEAVFLPFEVERILNIRLSEHSREDSRCWDKAKDGEYSVKEGYRLLAADKSGEGEQSDSSMGGWLWKTLWVAPVLPRIKAFMWQLCNNALPVKANIAARLRGVDGSCPRCHFEAESVSMS